MPRIQPAEPPYDADVQSAMDKVMRGRPPLLLFKVLARDRRLFLKFFAGGLLDPGHLTLREREIAICRTTALCRSAYEWNVHVEAFGAHAGFDSAQLNSLRSGSAEDACWSDRERQLIRLCDSLHSSCTVDTDAWEALRSCFTEEALLELLLVAGFYRTVSYLTNALDLPLESQAVTPPSTHRR
jgi:alkylhydroperoxidase family enzyme